MHHCWLCALRGYSPCLLQLCKNFACQCRHMKHMKSRLVARRFKQWQNRAKRRIYSSTSAIWTDYCADPQHPDQADQAMKMVCIIFSTYKCGWLRRENVPGPRCCVTFLNYVFYEFICVCSFIGWFCVGTIIFTLCHSMGIELFLNGWSLVFEYYNISWKGHACLS